jgi:glycosyltransferase involved in cell wall biosynthesis
MVVLPSFNEAMPMCLLEALASGKPAIATRVGSVPELIIGGDTGVLLEPGDASSLAASILRLLDNPEEGRRLGRNGRGLVRRKYSSEVMAQCYLGIYERTRQASNRQHQYRTRFAR